jgi:LacI family transcriptional regulator
MLDATSSYNPMDRRIPGVHSDRPDPAPDSVDDRTGQRIVPETARRGDRVAASRYGNRPTMKDVAARAGVGLKTVSRVVNGEPGVTPDTERRVQEAIDALGFRRNDSARVLRKGRTASIGLVLEDLADPFYGPLSRAVEEVARAHGALLINGSSAEDPEREQELVLALCARRVDGLVVIPAGDDHRYLEPEVKAGVATVFVDRPAGRIDADVVLSDSFGGARDGVAHLIAHGHRRIGFIGDMPRIHTAAERLRGYRAAMEDAGITVADGWMSLGVTDPERVRRAAEEMLSGPSPVTAVFAGNNRVTVTVVRVLAEVGRPVALVGFDDFELADLLRPGVTVVAQDAAALGRTAAERLFRQLDGGPLGPERIELPTRLIQRGSGELPPAT